jgi:hypothetical protein
MPTESRAVLALIWSPVNSVQTKPINQARCPGKKENPMSDEKNESRINIEDLPQAEQELTPDEAQQVQGGLTSSIKTSTGGTRDDAHKETIEIASFSWG